MTTQNNKERWNFSPILQQSSKKLISFVTDIQLGIVVVVVILDHCSLCLRRHSNVCVCMCISSRPKIIRALEKERSASVKTIVTPSCHLSSCHPYNAQSHETISRFFVAGDMKFDDSSGYLKSSPKHVSNKAELGFWLTSTFFLCVLSLLLLLLFSIIVLSSFVRRNIEMWAADVLIIAPSVHQIEMAHRVKIANGLRVAHQNSRRHPTYNIKDHDLKQRICFKIKS